MPCRRLLTLTACAMLTGCAVLTWFAVVNPVIGGLPPRNPAKTAHLAQAAPGRARIAEGEPGKTAHRADGAAGRAPRTTAGAPGAVPRSAEAGVPGRPGQAPPLGRPGPAPAGAAVPGGGAAPARPARPAAPAAPPPPAAQPAAPAARPFVPVASVPGHRVAAQPVHWRFRHRFHRYHHGSVRPVVLWRRPSAPLGNLQTMRAQLASARQVCARTAAIGMLGPWTAVCHWVLPG